MSIQSNSPALPLAWFASLAAAYGFRGFWRMALPAVPGTEGGVNPVQAGDLVGRVVHGINETVDHVKNGIDETLAKIVPSLLSGATFAVSKTAFSSLKTALESILEQCNTQPELNFGDSPQKLQEVLLGLKAAEAACTESESEVNKTAFIKAVQKAALALQEANVHILGISPKKAKPSEEACSLSTLDFSKKVEAPKELTSDELKKGIKNERDVLVINLKRAALVASVYTGVLGSEIPENIAQVYGAHPVRGKLDNKKELEKEEQAFKEDLFKGVWKKLQSRGIFSRLVVYGEAKLAYWAVSAFSSKIIEKVSSYGVTEIGQQADRLGKKEAVDALQLHIFTSFGSFLRSVWFHSYSLAEDIKENKEKSAKVAQTDKELLSRFQGDDGLRLDLSEEEFDAALVDKVLDNVSFSDYRVIDYCIRAFLSKLCKSNNAVQEGIKIGEKALKNEAGFSSGIDILLADLLRDLREELQAPLDLTAPLDSEEASSTKKEAIERCFSDLFSVTALMGKESLPDLIAHMNKVNKGEGSSLDFQEKVLKPAALGGASSLSLAVDKLLTPNKVKQLALSSLQAINESFVAPTENAAEEKAASQRRLDREEDALLDVVLDNALSDIPFVNSERATIAANSFITRLRNSTRDFIEKFNNIIVLEKGDLLIEDKKEEVRELCGIYLESLLLQESKVKENSSIGSGMKEELQGYYREVGGCLASLMELMTKEGATQPEYRKVAEKLGEQHKQMYHLLSCDIGEQELIAPAKKWSKSYAKGEMHKEVDKVKRLAKKDVTLRFLLQEAVLVPFLRADKV